MENQSVQSIKSKGEISKDSALGDINEDFVGTDREKLKALQDLLQLDDHVIGKMVHIENSHGYLISDQMTDSTNAFFDWYMKNRFRKKKVLIPKLHLTPFRDVDSSEKEPGNYKLPI